MSHLAFVFPGQGSQSVGMGRSPRRGLPRRRGCLRRRGPALGTPISALAWDGPAERLDLTENAQPAILATSIAILAALRERWAAEGLAAPTPAFAAGHSMGQYSALVAAGALDLEDGVRLVRERGRLMQASGQGRDGAMAALIGLDDARLPELVDGGLAARRLRRRQPQRPRPGRRLGRAPGHRGRRRARQVARCQARDRPARLGRRALAADGRGGRGDARRPGRRSTFHDPAAPLLANADGRPIETAEACRTELVEHLTAGVDWIRVVERMAAAGVTTFVEVGPGRVLTGLIKRIAPDAEVIPADDPASLDRLLALAAVPA